MTALQKKALQTIFEKLKGIDSYPLYSYVNSEIYECKELSEEKKKDIMKQLNIETNALLAPIAECREWLTAILNDENK